MKGFKKYVPIALLIASLGLGFNVGCEQKKETQKDTSKIINAQYSKKADPTQYLGIDFVTNSEQVKTREGGNFCFIEINYPDEKIPHFKVNYRDYDKDGNVDEYEVIVMYHRGGGKIISSFASEEHYMKHYYRYPTSIVEYVDKDLQKRVNGDYKKLKEKYPDKIETERRKRR